MSDVSRIQVESHAPARICDLGGWTDTWFSKRGSVLAIAVTPGATCQVAARSAVETKRATFTLEAVNSADRYAFDPHEPPMDRHPLLEASVAQVGVPEGLAVEASVSSGMPPGCGTGTSAAVTVALLGALLRLKGETPRADALWSLAHRVETDRLGWESGIQDQICASYGGICLVRIDSYPEAMVSRLDLSDDLAAELDRRLILVYTGMSRKSDGVHRRVISGIRKGESESAALDELRNIPRRGAAALLDGDLDRFGRAMVENTEAQRALHPDLVSKTADRIIEAARHRGAVGWKVNGAGGDGGSLTLLAGEDRESGERIKRELKRLGSGVEVLPARIDHEGLRVVYRASVETEGEA